MERFEDNIEKEVAKSNICYMDDQYRVVEKEKATKVVITEYDKDGNIINEVWGKFNNKEEEI